MTTSLHSDQPISQPGDDLFGRWPFANRMAEVIRNWKDPASLVIALYGEWGEGKTSVMNLMAGALSSNPDMVAVRFNPWRLGDEQQLLREFFRLISGAIGKSIQNESTQKQVADLLQKYGDCLAIVPEPQTALFGKLLGGAGRFVGAGAKNSNDVEGLRVQLDSVLRDSKKRIVVLLDDLDRLDYDEVDAIVRLVKLTADFPHTTYVLAFDPKLVAQALNRKFPGGDQSGQAFLEKIIQVAVQIPPADVAGLKSIAYKSIENALGAAGTQLSQGDADKFVIYFERGFISRLRSPRAAKRYANAISFGVPLLSGEVNFVDYLLVEALRIFYPDIYKAVRETPKVFLAHRERGGGQDTRKDVVDALLSGLHPKDAAAVEQVIKFLFPQLESGYGADWQQTWAKELRICSEAYCPRYFHYGVPPGDVSNKAIEQLIASAERAADANGIKTELQTLARGQSWATLVQKLREREKGMPAAASKNLALAIAGISEQLPRERGMFSSFNSTFGQGAILVSNLLTNVSADQRLRTAVELMSAPVPVDFAADCFRWMRPTKKEGADTRPLTEDEAREVGKKLGERIAAADQERALFESFPGEASSLYYWWQQVGSADVVAESLKRRFTSDPKTVLKYLEIFVPTAWSMETGVPHKSDLRRESYNQVVLFVDSDSVMAALEKVYGVAELQTQEFPYNADEKDPFKLWARQFAHIHRYVKAKEKGTDSAAEETPEAK